MNKLLVPIIENSELGNSQCCLFSVTAKTLQNRSKSLFNGCYYHYLNQKLSQSFTTERFSFEIYRNGKSDENDVFDNFSENTASISLGCFCAAYAVINNRQLKKQYGSITVTGNWNLTNTGNVVLSDVSLVREKFQAVKGYAEKYPNEDHLFVYISSKEEVDEDFHDNVLVIRFSSEDSINLVFAEIFEPVFSKEQKKDSFVLREMRPNTFVQTNSFIKWKKELAKPDCGGFILQGETNTGKSIIANSLCEWLLESRCIDSVVWITVNSSELWELMNKDSTQKYSFEFHKNLIKERYKKEFRKLDQALSEHKKVILVFDNLEYDFVDKVIFFYKTNYCLEADCIKLIITTQKPCKDKTILSELNIVEKIANEICLSEHGYYRIAYTLINQSAYKHKLDDEKKARKLISLIHKQFDMQPGYIRTVLALLKNNSVEEVIKLLNQGKVIAPQKQIWKILLEQLDFFSMLVLFAYIENSCVYNQNDILQIIENKFLSSNIKGRNLLSSYFFNKAWEELLKISIIQKVSDTDYILPTDAMVYYLFSDSSKKEIRKDIESNRDALIDFFVKGCFAVKLNVLDELKNCLDYIMESLGSGCYFDLVNQFLKIACFNDSSIAILEFLLNNGADPNYMDEIYEMPQTCLGYLVENTSSIDKVKLLIEKGANPFQVDRDGLTALMHASCNKCSVCLEFVLKNHLYEDINQESKCGSALQLSLYSSNLQNTIILLSNGAEYSTTPYNTLLQPAIFLSEKNTTALQYIIDNNLFSSIDEHCSGKYTALQLAILLSKINTCEILVDAGASITADCISNCCKPDKARILTVLLEKCPCWINTPLNEYGETALMIASHEGAVDIIELLLEKGADWKARDKYGQSCFMVAARASTSKAIKFLLENEYYEDNPDRIRYISTFDDAWSDIDRALFIACWQGVLSTCLYLLSKGANPDVKDIRGYSILHAAARNSCSHSGSLKYFLENKDKYKLDINLRSKDGLTPLDLAIQGKKKNAIILLRQYS